MKVPQVNQNYTRLHVDRLEHEAEKKKEVARVKKLLAAEEQVIQKIIAAGHCDPLNPAEKFNQIGALSIEKEDIRAPIVDFAHLEEDIIQIDQVTVKEVSDSRIADLNASFEKRAKKGEQELASPIVVKRVVTLSSNGESAKTEYFLWSGHNRKATFYRRNPGHKIPAIVVEEIVCLSGRKLTDEEVKIYEYRLKVGANQQIKDRPYEKPDCAKMVDVYARKLGKFNLTKTEFNTHMDELLGEDVHPSASCRTAIWNMYRKLNGTYTILDVKPSDVAGVFHKKRLSDPRKQTKTGIFTSKMKGCNSGRPFIYDKRTKEIYFFTSTDTSGTHIDTDIGIIARHYNKDPAKGVLALEVADAIKTNKANKKIPNSEKLKGILSVTIKGKTPESYRPLEAERDEFIKSELPEINTVLENSGIPIVFVDVCFPRQLDLESDRGRFESDRKKEILN
tara:strand:- start:6961 stop:8310 length:1350 start_codon:yes stop_codon:yes gene_type:complete